MLRLVSLPFSLFLLLLSVALVAAGLSVVADAEREADQAGSESGGALADIDIGGSGNDEPARADEGQLLAGVSMIGFGVLGAIAAVALLVTALSGRREPEVVAQPMQPQQQQQQVVVVTDGDARVDTAAPTRSD